MPLGTLAELLRQAVDILFLPWYSSSSVLETLGAGVEDACGTLQEFSDIMYLALQQPGAPALLPLLEFLNEI